MEMTSVKCEVSAGKHRFCMAEGNITNKCVKRRRRVHAASGIRFNEHQNGQQQADQSAPGTTAPKRSSKFRGVSRHKWTNRYEAHLWDKGSWNWTQKKKGKQVYLGAYDEEESAARAYDLAALKYWGPTTTINFPVSDYEKEITVMQNVAKEEYLATLRRKSSGFSRGVSKYRGVARHHHNGRWEARIGRVFGNKYLYLGTYSTQEEAAHTCDIAAIEYRGINAVTNFDLSTYIRWLRPGSNALMTSQEPLLFVESQEVPESSFFPVNPCSTIDYFSSPPKQEVLRRKSPVRCSNKPSSPTKLSLLLRSSVFKELVEKNSSSSDDESDVDDNRQRSQSSSDEYGGILYNGVANIPSYDSNSFTFEVEEEKKISPFSFYDKPFWTNVLITCFASID